MSVSSPKENREGISGLTSFESEAILNEHLCDAVRKGLAHFGGEGIVESLLYMLELEHSVDLKKIATNTSHFRSALTAMFGSGAYVVENKIKDEFARQEKVVGEGKSLDELVDLLRKEIESKSKGKQ